MTIRYPVQQYPEKVKSLDIEKLGTIEGTLWGIKGQYLIFDVGVINVEVHGLHMARAVRHQAETTSRFMVRLDASTLIC